MGTINAEAFTTLKWINHNELKDAGMTLFKASNADENDPLYLTKTIVKSENGSESILIGKYHPSIKSRDKFRFPNLSDEKKVFSISSDDTEVFCTGSEELKLEFSLTWEVVNDGKLPQNAVCFGENGDGTLVYAARGYQNRHGRKIVIYNEESDYCSPGTFVIDNKIGATGRAYIPYGKETYSPDCFEVLVQNYIGKKNISDQVRSFAVNAAEVAYNRPAFDKHANIANLNLDSLTFFASYKLGVFKDEMVSFNARETSSLRDYLNVGYVANGGPTENANDIVVGFRGTMSGSTLDWANNFLFGLVQFGPQYYDNPSSDIKVHCGFYFATQSLIDGIIGKINSIKHSSSQNLYVTGHSKGGAMAYIAAFILKNRYPDLNVSVYTFGAPKVGNFNFSERYDSVLPETYSYVFETDIVPRLPLTRDDVYFVSYLAALTSSGSEKPRLKSSSSDVLATISNITEKIGDFYSAININQSTIDQVSALIKAFNLNNATTVGDFLMAVSSIEKGIDNISEIKSTYQSISGVIYNPLGIVFLLYGISKVPKVFDVIKGYLTNGEELSLLFEELDKLLEKIGSLTFDLNTILSQEPFQYETVGNMRYTVSYAGEIEFLKSSSILTSIVEIIVEYCNSRGFIPIEDHSKYVKVLS